MKRVVIVGGGITGLAAAHALEKGDERRAVTLIEAGPQLGGNIQTLRHNGFIIDTGPDSWAAEEPHATELARDVGLGDELIGTRPDTRRVNIVWERKLYPMPESLTLGVPTEIKPFLASELLGWDAKARAALELVVPQRRWSDDEDESIGAFVSRRFGPDIAERIVGPVVSGIFAGDPSSLSARACAPQLVAAEREHGSLVVAMRARKDERTPHPATAEVGGSSFVSLKRGVGDLVVTVAHKLRDAEVFTSRAASKIVPLEQGDPRGRWRIETNAGELTADDVVLALSGRAAAPLVHDLDPDLSAMCGDIVYTSVASVFLAFRKFDVRHPLDSVGFLVPRAENRPILACTFVSSKWDHRAPAGQILLRVSVGGAGHEELVQRSNEDLIALARSQIKDLLGIDRPPMFSKVFRFEHSSPLPEVGHVARMSRLFARVALHPGLHLGGDGYLGMGISDAIRQGEEIASRILG
jgi:oxygen-dependent protoporphyrinogen oxidase